METETKLTEETLETKAEETVIEKAAQEAASAEEIITETPADEPVTEAAPAEDPVAEEASASEPVKTEEPVPSMADMGEALEKSYRKMGDGQHDTDALIAWEKIEELYEAKTELEVEITGIVKKGVIAMVEGIRGFIPESKLTLGRAGDLNDWLGRTVKVQIITADKEKDSLVLSARDILRRERDDAKKAKIAAVKVGSVITGKVESIQDYGAFIDLGDGVSGLVHVSQISREHVRHPSDLLEAGQDVKVKVIGNKDGKIKLSMKALAEQKKREEETSFKMPKTESVGTSMGDLLKNIKL
ncbi:MAG: S1 RNA-binding domain-containing protein [Clostridiales bacterium]|nr:S1 RNA-binding domain-containing protein [Clostridiales bacterium]